MFSTRGENPLRREKRKFSAILSRHPGKERDGTIDGDLDIFREKRKELFQV
jgi:hypothetical protein